MDLYKAILDELKARKLAHVNEIGPFYVSSIGTHKFNLVNQNKKIWTQGGQVINARQHILFVAPPGWGKSIYITLLLKDPSYSILNGTDVPCAFEGSITGTSSLVGTVVKSDEGKVMTKYGLAYEHSNGIVGVEEFSAITNIAKADYAGTLDTDMLLALDSGDLIRRMASKDIRYHTDFTLWGGVQPGRYDLSSGMGRRFLFIVFNPTWSDIIEFRNLRRLMQGYEVNQGKLKILRDQINLRFKEINHNLTGITFTSDFYKEIHRLNVMPYEEVTYEKLALGYWLMKMDRIAGDLVVGLDNEIKRIIQIEHGHRKAVKKGTKENQIIDYVNSLPNKEIKEKELIDQLVEFSMDELEIRELVQKLIGWGKLKRETKVDGFWLKLLRK